MNRGIQLVRRDKIVIMQPYMGQPDSTDGRKQRGFLLGTYYFPEYQLDLGPATTPLPEDVSQYLWNGVYRRDYANGIVLVNPNDDAFTLDLDGDYQLVSGTGGGAITDAQLDDSGQYVGGSLSMKTVSSVTLAPGSAVILLNQCAEVPAA